MSFRHICLHENDLQLSNCTIVKYFGVKLLFTIFAEKVGIVGHIVSFARQLLYSYLFRFHTFTVNYLHT